MGEQTKGYGRRFGPSAWVGARDFTPNSPSAPLSAQETELGLNIDFLLHKGGLGGGCCQPGPVWVYQPSAQNGDRRDFGLICSQLLGEKGGSREREAQVKASLSVCQVWTLGSGGIYVLVKPLCPGKAQLSSDQLHCPSLSPCRTVLLKSSQLTPNPHPATLPFPLRSRAEEQPSKALPVTARCPSPWCLVSR